MKIPISKAEIRRASLLKCGSVEIPVSKAEEGKIPLSKSDIGKSSPSTCGSVKITISNSEGRKHPMSKTEIVRTSMSKSETGSEYFKYRNLKEENVNYTKKLSCYTILRGSVRGITVPKYEGREFPITKSEMEEMSVSGCNVLRFGLYIKI